MCYNSFSELNIPVNLVPENIRYQNASGVAMAAIGKDLLSAADLMPAYLRLPQAERELKKRTEDKQ